MMNIGYDDGRDFEIPQSVIEAVEHIGTQLCLCQQKAEPELAWCWNWFGWRITRMFQIEYVYGGSLDDIKADDTIGALPWKYVQVSDIKEPKPQTSVRNRYPKFEKARARKVSRP